MRVFSAGMATVFCLLANSAVQAANLVKDPSFETPVVPVGNLTRFSNGDHIGNWTVVGASGTVDLISTTFTYDNFSFPAKAGKQWLDLSGNSQTATGVAQTVTTTPGTSYLLTFSVGSVYDTGGVVGTQSAVNVYNGSTLLGRVVAKGVKGTTTQHWKTFKITFTATAAKTTLSFINDDPSNDTDCGLDVVTLAPVTTSSKSKLLAGLRSH